MMPDLHRALKTEVLDRQSSEGFQVVLARLQNGKNDITHSVHVFPSTYTSSGIQTTDMLAYLGFRRYNCSFEGGYCYARGVETPFDLPAFAAALPRAYTALHNTDNHLAGCGLFIPHPEGTGYFFNKPSQELRQRNSFPTRGDGHTAESHDRLKQSEDAYFQFALTGIRSSDEIGWTIHYRPRHEPLSTEMRSAFSFLELKSFLECPEFDFEPCHWRFVPHVSKFGGGSVSVVFGGEGDHAIVRGQFDAHMQHFSPGLEALLQANVEVEPFGMAFLPDPTPTPQSSSCPIVTSPSTTNTSTTIYKYDVAISFAGPQRALAETLAARVKETGFRVFFDDYYQEQLWGKNLIEYFDDVYRKQSRYCVIFVSPEYRDRMWTTHERQSAQARALLKRGNDYILPIMIEDIELPGMPGTVGYLSLKQYPIDAITDLLIKKLSSTET